MCPLRVILLCPLRVILLWTLLCAGTGKVQEIFTRPGSDLLLPIRIHPILNHTDRQRCDRIIWRYKKFPGDWEEIAEHRNCNPYDLRYFPNTRLSENGSLIISNVTLENDGIYNVYIENSTGPLIQGDYYTVHVEGKVQEIFTRPGSDLLIPIRRHLTLNHPDRWRCDRIIWYYEESPGDWEEIAEHKNCNPSDLRYFPNTRISENGSLIISNVTPENDGRYHVYIENSTGHHIQRDYYTVRVEGKVQEIFTRPGSDLLIPITRHLTLNHPDTGRCDRITWYYEESPGVWKRIAQHWYCDPSDFRYFPNTRISENGSLIISNVTPENDGIYRVYIYNSTGHLIQRDDYFIHVEGKVQEIFTRPGSDLLIPIRRHLTLNPTDRWECNEIIWYYEKSPGYWNTIAQHWYCYLSDLRYFPNTRISENGSLIISNVTPENDGIYRVYIENATGRLIQRDDYFIHVEGKVPEEIFTRPGSDLLLPIRRHLTLNPTDRRGCDWIIWYYEKSPGDWEEIAQHWNCDPSDLRYFPNTRISENGSLIISNVTPENDGRYNVDIYNSAGLPIQEDDYTVHVEGKVQEIFTRPGSDLLIPIRIHLTLNHTDTGRCDRIYWYYEKSHGDWEGIAEHRNCNPSDVRYFPNTRISENGSLIISNVTPENDGIYHVYIENSTGHHIQRDDYTVHVEGKVQEIFTRPGSDLLIPIRIHLTLNHTDRQRCDRIIWYYEKSPGDWKKIAQHRNCDPSDLRYFPNTRISENGSLIISNVTPENDGRYRVYIYNSTRQLIQRDDYTVHVEGKSR
ncbi:uncharacterized protein LOC143973417 [Lithobates pipiens]